MLKAEVFQNESSIFHWTVLEAYWELGARKGTTTSAGNSTFSSFGCFSILETLGLSFFQKRLGPYYYFAHIRRMLIPAPAGDEGSGWGCGIGMGHGYIGIIEYGIFRHGETREECLQPVYTKYGAHRVGNNNPSQIAKNNLDINTLT